jgi:oxygen-independent coproporphyrinogen-3 oxidase
MTDDQPGLYVHVPFCSAKCRYCDFYSLNAPRLIPTYLNALSREAAVYAPTWPESFDSLYIGGGTPTRLSNAQLQNLFESLSIFAFDSDIEITVEANPEDITDEKIQALKSQGVNRISLGVQSLDDRELAFLGRRHTAQQALDSVKIIKSAGLEKIGLDLIYGLPGQTATAWQRTLEQTVAFKPDHLSCYMLTIETGTAMHRDFETGKVTGLDEETARELFFLTSRFLSDHGYDHYEVSNFARGKENRSRHNSKYWFGADYLGLGPAAHSFRNKKRWWNVRSIRRWAERLADGKSPVHGREQLTAEQRRIEAIFLGLRTRQGIHQDTLAGSKEAQTLVDQWREAGLAISDGNRIVLTLDGLVVSDALAQSLTDQY